MGKNKREKSKYPALSRNLNLKSRKDYIEADEYIDGVRNSEGEIVIRPLTDEEKQFLNDFYAETIITNFLHDPRLKKLTRDKQNLLNNETTKSIKLQIKKLKEDKEDNREKIIELKQIIKTIKDQNKDLNQDKINEINKEMQEIRDEVLLYPNKEDHKQFYNSNNSRNNCLYNRSIMMNKMTFIDEKDFDMFSDHVSDDVYDYEDYLIYELEERQYQKEGERLKEVMKEEKESKKKV